MTIFAKNRHLGYFSTEEEAARVYNLFAKDIHGDYARFNEVDPLFPDSEWRSERNMAKSNFINTYLKQR